MNTLLIILLGILCVIVYFIPTRIAFNNTHPHRWGILIANIFFGITGCGWIICLIWAIAIGRKINRE